MIMEKKNHRFIILYALLIGIFVSCSDNITENIPFSSSGVPIQLAGSIDQENTTRANDQGFVLGDRMGIYVVDYVNGQPGQLDATNNRASNVLFTFDAETYKWSSPTTLYWRDNQTPVDIYGYYPGANAISDPAAYMFEVKENQNAPAANGSLAGYEASDLLWGKVSQVQPTDQTIVVNYRHILAGVRVSLQKGTGISDIEWEKLGKTVLIDNTVRTANVDLGTGTVTPVGSTDRSVQMLEQSEDYRAIVIPQTIDAGKTLISVTIDGTAYTHKLTSAMNYQAGKLHNFTITINKSEATGDYELKVVNDGITPWMNDETSHQFSSMQYVIVHCTERGKLKECITNAGYDYKTMQNLKVTGEVDADDYSFLAKEMPKLQHLNLHDASGRHVHVGHNWDTDEDYYEDNVFTGFYGNKTLRSIVIPSSTKAIANEAFREMNLMYSTLEIPEGVTKIGANALAYNGDYNGVELILPSTLDTIEVYAFSHCSYRCELKLSDNITYVGHDAFKKTPNFHGTFHIPSKMKQIDGAFDEMGSNGSFDGEIEIPQGVTSVEGALGVSMNKRVVLDLPQGVKKIGRGWPDRGFTSIHFNDDLTEIEEACFAWYPMPPDGITLPSSLVKIGYRAFIENGLEGELIIPEGCLDIGGEAFKDAQITKLQLPSRLEIINGGTFRNLGRLTNLTIPKFVSYIGEVAFSNCTALQTVICLNPEPPELGKDAFAGLYFDKVVLEVPEASVEIYRHTDGWKDFQNITAYHELAFNIPEISCLDKGTTRQGILRAEGDWEVSECPSWVTVSPTSGTYKEELTITIASTTESREGRIVFRLKDKDYTTYTDVRQVCSNKYKEDATVTLQTASAGGTAIPIFLVGEGYGADDIASGQYLQDMKAQMEHLFSIEPYKSYRNYFTVSTAYACSPQQGLGGLTKFSGNNNTVWTYAQQHGTAINDHAAVLVLCNTPAYAAHTDLWDNGLSFSWLGKNEDVYPYDQRGDVLHYLGGRGFGKLGPEYVNHFTFMKACGCPNCNMTNEYNRARSKGWWQNVSITPKMTELPWYPFIFHENYAQYVDVYEGALNHARSTYRSENQSVMGATHIYYYNTISRYEIVRRIMQAAGKTITFEQFVQNDKIEIPED